MSAIPKVRINGSNNLALRPSKNILIARGQRDMLDGQPLECNGRKFTYFRNGPDGIEIYLSVKPQNLTLEDIGIINMICEKNEGPKNRAVKETLSTAITSVFNGKSFHLTEFGPGKFPISDNLEEEGANFTYHGIEIESKARQHLLSRGIAVSGWNGLPSEDDPTLLPGRPRIAVAVYSMHFLADDKLPGRIKRAISGIEDGGFFVGNLYRPRDDKDFRRTCEKLRYHLNKGGLNHLVLGTSETSRRRIGEEFWIVTKPGDVENLNNFAGVLRAAHLQNGQPELALVT